MLAIKKEIICFGISICNIRIQIDKSHLVQKNNHQLMPNIKSTQGILDLLNMYNISIFTKREELAVKIYT